MAGVKAYDRASYLADIKTLKARRLTDEAIARQLGISVRTLYRIKAGK